MGFEAVRMATVAVVNIQEVVIFSSAGAPGNEVLASGRTIL